MNAPQHLDALRAALDTLDTARAQRLGEHLAGVLDRGGRLLAAGNGGSAAQAQHLTAELVGRYREERRPLSAIALHAETSSLTAIGNDYAFEEVFSRQVRAHGREGDVLLALSTSGRSRNLVAAVETARDAGVAAWAFTGPAPNPLFDICDETIAVEARSTATVQEAHLVLLHLLCEAIDGVILGVAGAARSGAT